MPLLSIISRMRIDTSGTETAAATVVFLMSAITVLPSGAIAPRNACGRITSRAASTKGSPIARAASACPTGTVFTPDRRASQKNEA